MSEVNVCGYLAISQPFSVIVCIVTEIEPFPRGLTFWQGKKHNIIISIQRLSIS